MHFRLLVELQETGVADPDYQNLIDEETWRFIEATSAHYPANSVSFSIAEQRAVYDRMCQAFFAGYPEGISTQDVPLGGVPCRVYSTGRCAVTVVYFHGGGFVVGGLDSHDDVCAELCAATGFRVVSVAYRLAPEHPHPASFDDSLAATRATAHRWPGITILAGDSAGGNLAAAVTHTLRGRSPKISGQLLIYPVLGHVRDTGSHAVHTRAPLLTREDIEFYEIVRFRDGFVPGNDPTATPLSDNDFSNLPPTVILTAECDPVSSDGQQYRDRVLAAGGKAHWVEEPGLVHSYLRARHSVFRARQSFERIIAGLQALGKGDWPY
jgi:acetyl esterase